MVAQTIVAGPSRRRRIVSAQDGLPWMS